MTEEILSEILTELQIHNKLKALQLTHELVHNAPIPLKLNGDAYTELLKGLEKTLQGEGLKEMM